MKTLFIKILLGLSAIAVLILLTNFGAYSMLRNGNHMVSRLVFVKPELCIDSDSCKFSGSQVYPLAPEEIGLSYKLLDSKKVIMEIKNTSGIYYFNYQLSYVSKGIPRGVVGSMDVVSDDPIRRMIDLGRIDEEVVDIGKIILKISRYGKTYQVEKSLEN